MPTRQRYKQMSIFFNNRTGMHIKIQMQFSRKD